MNFETHRYFDMAADQAEINKEKVVCPKCQTDGMKGKVILYPGQTVPKMKYTDGYWNEDGAMVHL